MYSMKAMIRPSLEIVTVQEVHYNDKVLFYGEGEGFTCVPFDDVVWMKSSEWSDNQ